MRPLGGTSLKIFNFFPAALTHCLYISNDVAVIGVEPELVKRIRRGAIRVEPPVVTRLALTEFGAIRFGQQRCGHRVNALPLHPANQIYPAEQVAPLIIAARLQSAVITTVQLEVIHTLQNLVAELGEA